MAETKILSVLFLGLISYFFSFFLVFLKEKNAISFLVMFKFNTNFLVFNSNKTWKFDGDSKSDFFYLKWLSEQQKFVIMIRCKINFDIIWYSVIFAANVYRQYSSDHLIFWTSFLWMLLFLLYPELAKEDSRWHSNKIIHSYGGPGKNTKPFSLPE